MGKGARECREMSPWFYYMCALLGLFAKEDMNLEKGIGLYRWWLSWPLCMWPSVIWSHSHEFLPSLSLSSHPNVYSGSLLRSFLSPLSRTTVIITKWNKTPPENFFYCYPHNKKVQSNIQSAVGPMGPAWIVVRDPVKWPASLRWRFKQALQCRYCQENGWPMDGRYFFRSKGCLLFWRIFFDILSQNS